MYALTKIDKNVSMSKHFGKTNVRNWKIIIFIVWSLDQLYDGWWRFYSTLLKRYYPSGNEQHCCQAPLTLTGFFWKGKQN